MRDWDILRAHRIQASMDSDSRNLQERRDSFANDNEEQPPTSVDTDCYDVGHVILLGLPRLAGPGGGVTIHPDKSALI